MKSLLKIGTALLFSSLALSLSSCAYNQAMNERTAEGLRLQTEIDSEVARGKALTR